MIVPLDWEPEVQTEGTLGARTWQPSGQNAPAETREQLQIAQRRRVEVRLVLDHGREPEGYRRARDVVPERRRVNDECSRCSRSSLSSRIRSANETPRSIGSWLRIASKTSSRGGRATSRSKISSMNDVKVCPRSFARRLSSLCKRSGTFLTWIILAMLCACYHMRFTCSFGHGLTE